MVQNAPFCRFLVIFGPGPNVPSGLETTLLVVENTHFGVKPPFFWAIQHAIWCRFAPFLAVLHAAKRIVFGVLAEKCRFGTTTTFNLHPAP